MLLFGQISFYSCNAVILWLYLHLFSRPLVQQCWSKACCGHCESWSVLHSLMFPQYLQLQHHTVVLPAWAKHAHYRIFLSFDPQSGERGR